MSDEASSSRRERQIMDLLHGKGELTAKEVQEGLANPPSYSAVRALLRILEEKGHVKHREDGNRYVFTATRSREKASRSALHRVVSTFFGGSRRLAIAALLDEADTELTPQQIERLQKVIQKTKEEERS